MKILKFTAKWCIPCHHVEPVLDEAEEHYGAEIERIDVEDPKTRELQRQYHVQSLPTLVILKNGKTESLVGTVTGEKLGRIIDKM